MKDTDLFAVYGSLRNGFGNHGIIAQFSPELVSVEALHGWKMVSMGPFPAIYKSNDQEDYVVVEVYSVPAELHSQAAQSLDWLEGFPDFYDRELVDTDHGKAWVYFREEHEVRGLTPVESGDWVEYYGA